MLSKFKQLKEKSLYQSHLIGTSGNYSTSDQYQFYQSVSSVEHDNVPFSQTVFEASPLSRPLKNYGPGEDWDAAHSNKYIGMSYLANTDGSSAGTEKIIAWKVTSDMPVRNITVSGAASGAGYYPSGALNVNSVIDEHGNEVREYTTKTGQVILKKVYLKGSKTDLNNTDNWAQTYYIYDELDNVRFVLQPELVKTVAASSTYNPSSTDLNNFAFQYKYDSRNRMIVKRVPGAEEVYMVYDKRDRLVLTQDGNQRRDAAGATKRQWTFTKYDRFNRPI